MVSLKGLTFWGVPAVAFTLAVAPVAQLMAQESASAGDPANGNQVFDSAGCGACHALAAADATGPIGPSLDKNANINAAFVKQRVAEGAGAMPPFSGQLTDQDIADVTAYVVSAAAK